MYVGGWIIAQVDGLVSRLSFKVLPDWRSALRTVGWLWCRRRRLWLRQLDVPLRKILFWVAYSRVDTGHYFVSK